MKKLIVCFIVLEAILLSSEISSAQSSLLPQKDFFLDSNPLLDTKFPDIITLPGYNFDRGILLPLPYVQNCDPGILFHLNKKDLDIDPGIFVPFNRIANMGQPEFFIPYQTPYFYLPLLPNLMQNLNIRPFDLLHPNNFYMPDFDLNMDMLTPNEKFDLGIHKSSK